MRFQSGDAWEGNESGRPKGSTNRSCQFRDVLWEVFERAGGSGRLAEVCKKDRDFMLLAKILASLQPRQDRVEVSPPVINYITNTPRPHLEDKRDLGITGKDQEEK